jgi:hypothetical protein
MINTGTTPVLPQSVINNFWTGGLTGTLPPKTVCYTTTNKET